MTGAVPGRRGGLTTFRLRPNSTAKALVDLSTKVSMQMEKTGVARERLDARPATRPSEVSGNDETIFNAIYLDGFRPLFPRPSTLPPRLDSEGVNQLPSTAHRLHPSL